MSKYPENFDDSQSLPSPYGKNVVFISRYTCKVNSGDTEALVDAETQNSFAMELNTRYLININCGIVSDIDSSDFSNYCASIYAYYDCTGVTITELINTLGINYEFNISNSSNILLMEVKNNTISKVTASAMVDYIKI